MKSEKHNTNSQGKLDTSSCQPKVDNSKTCGNCGNFVPYCHRPDIGKCLKNIVHWTTYDIKAHDCTAYEPEQN